MGLATNFARAHGKKRFSAKEVFHIAEGRFLGKTEVGLPFVTRVFTLSTFLGKFPNCYDHHESFFENISGKTPK